MSEEENIASFVLYSRKLYPDYYESKERFHSMDGHAASQTARSRMMSVYYESKGCFHSMDGYAASQTAGKRMMLVYFERLFFRIHVSKSTNPCLVYHPGLLISIDTMFKTIRPKNLYLELIHKRTVKYYIGMAARSVACGNRATLPHMIMHIIFPLLSLTIFCMVS